MIFKIVALSIHILNRYFEISDSDNFHIDFPSDNLEKNKINNINLILNCFTFNNIMVSFVCITGGVVIVYYLNESYHEFLVESLQNFKEYLNPPIIHKPNSSLILIKASKDFLFYKEVDIQRILGFRLKRYKDFLKENEEKLPYVNLDQMPIKIDTKYIF